MAMAMLAFAVSGFRCEKPGAGFGQALFAAYSTTIVAVRPHVIYVSNACTDKVATVVDWSKCKIIPLRVL